MEERRKLVGRPWHKGVLFALGAFVAMMLIAQPVGAHFLPSIRHIWHHIEPKADARYVPKSGVAWALVNPDGTFVAGKRKNFTAVSSPSANNYCLTPKVGVLPGKAVIVSPEWGNSSGGSLFAYWYESAADCSPGQVEVKTEGGSGASAVAFSVLIP